VRYQSVELAGLRSIVVGSEKRAESICVLLHGYAMRPEDLAPFAQAMRSNARFYFPQGPVAVGARGYGWWPIDEERRREQLRLAPRDLAEECPVSRPAMRAGLCQFIAGVRAHARELPLLLGGFSQGGMLVCDTVLHQRPDIAGMVILSASRIAAQEWQPRLAAVRSLPVFISHGRADTDLAFAAGERLRDCLESGGARITWTPFDGGHEIPFVVWRELRKFIAVTAGSARALREL